MISGNDESAQKEMKTVIQESKELDSWSELSQVDFGDGINL